jgi:hypothetical protein
MRRRKLLVALAGLAGVIVAGVVVLWPWAPSRITPENIGRIWESMSRAEVEAILGPPGEYRTGPTKHHEMHVLSGIPRRACPYWYFEGMPPPQIAGVEPEVWAGDSGDAHVYFGHTGVSSTIFWPAKRVPQGPLQTLLYHAKRQWHRWFSE